MIRVLSTTAVRPTSRDYSVSVRRIELTPSDLVAIRFGYMYRGLLFEKPKESPVEHLKATFSRALDRLYPLAGRLVATEHDGDTKTVSFHVECNDAGATFVHAEAVDSVSATRLLDRHAIPMEIVGRLFPMNGVSNYQAARSDLPLLAVQVTEFVDGIYVAISLNHCVADGTTLWDFFSVWSELARGDSAAISRRGAFAFGRECFDGVLDFPIRIPRLGIEPPRAIAVVPATAVEQRLLRFSKAKITELKARVNKESPQTGRHEISSFQAMMAHLWVCITRCRALRDDDVVCLVVAVGVRSRLRPQLPQFYMGNALLSLVVVSTAGELLRRGTAWAAGRVNEAIAARAGMGTKEFFEECAKSLSSMMDSAKVPPNILAFSGSSRFDVFGNDFGWGRPVAQGTCLGAGRAERQLNASPGPEEGSVDFEAVFLAKTFQALARDPEFMEYSS